MKFFRFVLPMFLAASAPAFATVSVSSPASGSTVISPVHYVATATASTCAGGVASMGIYVNNKLIYTVKAKQLNTEITLATGAQHTVVEEWDKCGKATYATVNLTVVAGKPTVSISSNPASVKKGSASVLTVVATNSTKVKITGSNGSSYALGTTGGTQSVTPTATATYTVTATGAAGTTATAKTTVTVTANPVPTISISASPNPISAGSASVLTVSAANATQVTITGGGTTHAVLATGGTESVSPTATTTYTATATGAGGKSTATVTVTVSAAPTVSITAKPTSITAGSSSILTVTATNATGVTLTGSDNSSYTVALTGGSVSVSPTKTTTYTATATGASVKKTATATVTVGAAPTVSLTAKPASITAGSSSVLTMTAANATAVTLTGSDSSSYTVALTGGNITVSPTKTTTYTATATAGGVKSTATASVTVGAAPTVSLTAKPASITAGSSSVLTVTAANATAVTLTGNDNSSYSVAPTGGTVSVSPTKTTTYTATATGIGGTTVSSNTTVTVGANAVTAVSVSPSPTSFALGDTQQFTAQATYSDGSTADVTSTATWSIANTTVATIDSSGLATSQASGSTTVTASKSGVSGNAPVTVTIASGTGVNIPTWHGDTLRSGLNAKERSLSTLNVASQSFGKLFSYSINGYAYAQPLLMSGVSINGATHNVLYVATETNDVYAFDADNYGTGKPLWHVTTMQSGETPDKVGSTSAIYPTIGITSTPVIDPATNIMYLVSKQTSSSNGTFFRLNALDITTGNQVLGGPVTISASVPATNGASVNGVQTLTTSCIQRSALLLDHNDVYFGFGSCHAGWMLSYNKTSLLQSGVFNASTILDGEGQWASAGGVWMAGGGPASYGNSGDGSVFITTGNGPWDGQTAWSDSVLKFSAPPVPTSNSGSAVIQPVDYFTPKDYQYMDCADGDLAAGGLLLIPNTTKALAGAKTAWLYLVDTSNLGQEQAGDAGALDTLIFESDLGSQFPAAAPFSKNCTDNTPATNTVHTIQASEYEVYGTSAYFDGSVYLGVTAEAAKIPAGVRQFTLSGNTLTPSTYTNYGTDQEIRGTTPFISADGNSGGVLWMIDQNEPLGATGGYSPGIAILRAFDPSDLSTELYDSNMTPSDAPGYGIKFTSPIVGNGKVYIATGTNLESTSSQVGEIDVYGLN